MTEQTCHIFISDCHVRAAAELISHTWDPVVLSALRLGPTRRNLLLQRIAGVSDKALAQALRRLRTSGLITKTSGRTPAPTGTTYQLTPLGHSFANGPLAHLAQWAADNHDAITDPATP